jgi:hypothetical protein
MRVECIMTGPWKSRITREIIPGQQAGEICTVVGVSKFNGEDYYDLAEWPPAVPSWPIVWHHSQFRPVGKEPDISVFTKILENLPAHEPEFV